MPETDLTDGRVPKKQRLIVDELRRQILRGEIPPGGRIPTQLELSKRFRVSNVTVLRAMDRLAHEGVLVVRGRLGTFVANHPPHLSTFGLAFPTRPTHDEAWASRFYSAITQEWHRLGGASRRTSIYFGIAPTGSPDEIARLIADMREHRLAGLFLAAAKVSLPVIAEHAGSMPLVGIGAASSSCVAVHFSPDAWAARAAQWLAARGRKRIAMVHSAMQTPETVAVMVRTIEAHGLSTRAPWMQAAHPACPSWARNCTHLLMDRPAENRPDGLLVTDESLVEDAVRGLVEVGVRVAVDLDVVAHCNFPRPVPAMVPVRHLGYDIGRMLAGALDIMEARRRGRSTPQTLEVPPVFEEETSQAVAAK